MTYDFVIIGAGITGTIVARELSRFSTKILLIEKENDVSMGSTKANSAVVHGGYDDKYGTLKAKLCYKGRQAFEKYNSELNFGYRKTGSLVVGFDEEDREILNQIYENGLKNGTDDISILEQEEILKMEPALNPDVKYALYCAGAGVCSPYEFAVALAENALENGAELKLNSKVTDIVKHDDYNYMVIYDEISGDKVIKREINTRYVINAAGLSGDRISEMINEKYFTIKPRKGEYVLFARDTGSILNNVIFQTPSKLGKGVLVTSTYHGNLLIGPDAQNDSDRENTGTDMESLEQILKRARHVTEEFDMKTFIRTFSGIRAVADTGDFIIEETKSKGFINIAGIQSPGLTSSPAVAEMVIEIIKNSGFELKEKENFNPYRKPLIKRKTKADMLSAEEVNRLLNSTVPEEKIICRCEQVTEKTILDSLRSGITVTSTDGVKRRTRAGMGWCQGSFCRERVKEIIEKEYGISVNSDEDIHNSGITRVGKTEFLEYIKNSKK